MKRFLLLSFIAATLEVNDMDRVGGLVEMFLKLVLSTDLYHRKSCKMCIFKIYKFHSSAGPL